MKKQAVEAVHEVCGILMSEGPWDHDIQVCVDFAALNAEGILNNEVSRALALIDRAYKVLEREDVNEPSYWPEVEAIQEQARELARDCEFDFEEGVEPAALLPFDDAPYCPTCAYHMDDHDMRQVNAGGTVGVCPVPEAGR